MFTFWFDFDRSPHMPNEIYTRNICRQGGFQGRRSIFVDLCAYIKFKTHSGSATIRASLVYSSSFTTCTRFNAGIPAESKSQSILVVDCLRISTCAVSDSQSFATPAQVWALCSSNPPHQAHQFLQHLQWLFWLRQFLSSLSNHYFSCKYPLPFNHAVRFWLRYLWRID